MANKDIPSLADYRRSEKETSLREMDDRDMCEMIRMHFNSHPALPGEKAMKDRVNEILDTVKPDESVFLLVPEKRELAEKFAQTCIRETTLKEGNQYLDFRHYNPAELERTPLSEYPIHNRNPYVSDPEKDNTDKKTKVHIDVVNVELQKNDAGEVYVLADRSDGGRRTIGSLSEKFLKNNPMNVNYCRAEMELTDYSNGKMKNISAKLVVDTDLMSGDVIDLNEDMLAGLNQESGLNQ